jgi:hypothetical protein
MNILLVEPEYYTQYPPLGLLKIASFHRSYGDRVQLVRGFQETLDFIPDIIKITSLFTYAWKPVHKIIEQYHSVFPNARMIVGGLYASIMPDRLRKVYPFIEVHVGLFEESEQYIPSYDLLKNVDKWKDWKKTILFTSRGCIRKCPFCIVPQLEGQIRQAVDDIRDFIHPSHKEVIIWDNNFLASPDWEKNLLILAESGLKIDFNQGLDARLINEENANLISELRTPLIRMAYDFKDEYPFVEKAVNLFESAGLRKKNMLFYSLYNFYNPVSCSGDTPEDFFDIITDIAKLGCVSYPMRYEPSTALEKNKFISPFWTQNELEMVADARRVIGRGGAFPPYEGLVNKFTSAKGFDEAFKLWPEKCVV